MIWILVILFISAKYSDGQNLLGLHSKIVKESSGNVVSNPGKGVKDFDGNLYSTVVLGNGQEWMAENLRTTSYANGDKILKYVMGYANTVVGHNLNSGEWYEYTYQPYPHRPSNYVEYGKHYNWFAATDSRNICPKGWHLPSYNEWSLLIDYLGGLKSAPGKMKSPGRDKFDRNHWSVKSLITNESGFSAVPAGRFERSLGNNHQSTADWWSSRSDYPLKNWHIVMMNINPFNREDELFWRQDTKVIGLSVRCIKD